MKLPAMTLDQYTRYTKYMIARGFNTAEESYQLEWAHRFAAGIEWSASDSIGQAVLRRINGQGASSHADDDQDDAHA